MSDTLVHLEGKWILTEMTCSDINALAGTFEQIGSGCVKSLRIDCERVIEVDANGVQLLNIWLQCLRFLDVEPELVNVPGNLQGFFQKIIGKGDA